MSLPACSPLQRTGMWACVFLSQCNLSISSSVFPLTTPFFVQCQANLVERQGSQRQWNSNEFHENYMFKKREPEITRRKIPSWRQHCHLSHGRQKQQRVSRRMGTEKRNPRRLCHRRSSLQIALYPKMKFAGNQALVPSLTKLRAVPLSPAYMWKFLLPSFKPSHWNTCLVLVGICVVFCRLGLGVGVCVCLIDWFLFCLRCGGQRASGLCYWAWFVPSAKVPAKNTRLMVFCMEKVCLLSLGLKLILGGIWTQFITLSSWLFWWK